MSTWTRQAERRLVVYLDDAQRRWLRGVEADALRDDVRLSASAIVRLAIDELRSCSVGWRGLAERSPKAGNQPDVVRCVSDVLKEAI
jgi:hypothetical protein